MAKRNERIREGKENIIVALINGHNIKISEDIQDTLKELLDDTIKIFMTLKQVRVLCLM